MMTSRILAGCFRCVRLMPLATRGFAYPSSGSFAVLRHRSPSSWPEHLVDRCRSRAFATKGNGRKEGASSVSTSTSSKALTTPSGGKKAKASPVRRPAIEAAAARSKAIREQVIRDQAAQASVPTTPTTADATTRIKIQARGEPEAGQGRDAGLEVEEVVSPTATAEELELPQVIAYASAESYDFHALKRSGTLPKDAQLLADTEGEVIHVPRWPPNADQAQGEAFVFRSGSYVTWGMSEEDSELFLKDIIRGQGNGSKAWVEKERYQEVGEEALDYLISDKEATRVVGDLLVIGARPTHHHHHPPSSSSATTNGVGQGVAAVETNTDHDPSVTAPWTPLLARLAFSQGLARSARLTVFETYLESYLADVSALPDALMRDGEVPLTRKEVIKKLGSLLKLRQRLNLNRENFFDDPDIYWENPVLEDHYRSICLALDIPTRFRNINEKINYAEELQSNLRALLTERSSHRMELIIIALIAVEVFLALVHHGSTAIESVSEWLDSKRQNSGGVLADRGKGANGTTTGKGEDDEEESWVQSIESIIRKEVESARSGARA